MASAWPNFDTAEVVAGVGQICKVELKLAATSIMHARRIACTACRLFASRAICLLMRGGCKVACGAVKVLVRCKPASARVYAGRAR